MSRGPDIGTMLGRALAAHAEAGGCEVTVTTSDCTRWASATFTGARHQIALSAVPSPALIAWIAALPEAEFSLRGHLVADMVVQGVRHTGEAIAIELEALTVEDR